MSTRIDRISEEVMKALAETLRSVKDPRVQNAMVSVVHCDVTNAFAHEQYLIILCFAVITVKYATRMTAQLLWKVF